MFKVFSPDEALNQTYPRVGNCINDLLIISYYISYKMNLELY
jgi:hypothetical protein